ncbi:MAG: 50S ribosomal protein L30 [Candidatus Sumerlaeota bacterium]
MAEKSNGKIQIKWVKSINNMKEPQKRTIRALGFHRLNEMIERDDTPQIRGMVNAVGHLVEVTEVSE